MKEFVMWKSVLYRFLRGGVASAVASMILINSSGVNTFETLKGFFIALGYSAIIGFTTGGLLALDKYFRAE